jgi:Cd2+/Zn2+-exporting ATPase
MLVTVAGWQAETPMHATTAESIPAPGLRLKIAGMDCGSCALTIENSMRQLPGVRSVAVSFTTESMEIAGDVAQAEIETRLRELGYSIAKPARSGGAAAAERGGFGGFARFLWQQPRLRIAVATGLVVALSSLALAGGSGNQSSGWFSIVCAVAVLLVGAPIFAKGFRALVFARRITIDLLMAIATIGALAIGEGGEAATVILLFTLGEALEAYSAARARDSLRSLMLLQPQEATVLREHDDAHEPPHGGDDHHDHDHEHEHEHEHEHDHEVAPTRASHVHATVVPVDQVAVGETVLVRPGQRIPVDGVVLNGSSGVNQAAVTGESMPVQKSLDDDVLAGTVNGEGALEIQATKPAGQSTIAQIARLVEQAQSQRSPAERFIDRFARWYTPAVVLLAALVVAIPVWGFGMPLLDGSDGAHGWLYRALALLIIACPCALVISIPVTVVSGLTRLANLGVLVKGGAQLDRMASVRTVAFDKTGTLTRGRPTVTAVGGESCEHPPAAVVACESCDDVVALAASVEAASEHPVAHAIVSEARVRSLGGRYQPARGVTAHAGRGVSGELDDGRRIAVGTDALIDGQFDVRPAMATEADRARNAGNTVMYVARENTVVGYIGVQDQIREASRNALAELHSAKPPVRVVMLTGDSAQVARNIADQAGLIDEVRAGLLPEGKLRAVEDLRERYGTVAMVGDGINDAPALARADVGIAMGRSGTAQAMETADVVLMQDDLSHVPMALRIARKSRRFIRQNIALSLGLKLAFLALAIPGITTLWMAVLADVGATMLVTLNGMRLLRET